MIDTIINRILRGNQAVPNLRKARPSANARLHPWFNGTVTCGKDCSACASACPSQAITIPAAIDLGRCVLCGECGRRCPAGKIVYKDSKFISATNRQDLVITSSSPALPRINVRPELKKLFGRSIKLRSVSTGGCNACESELNACGNVNFDAGRFGIEFTASPRHADGLVITGPLTKAMAPALLDTYAAMPSPKIVVLAGSCAISAGLFRDAPDLDRSFLDKVPVDLFVPGCPPHPLTVINAVLDLIGRK
jgi:Ni,Fe-hydrogenase III small subunit